MVWHNKYTQVDKGGKVTTPPGQVQTAKYPPKKSVVVPKGPKKEGK